LRAEKYRKARAADSRDLAIASGRFREAIGDAFRVAAIAAGD